MLKSLVISGCVVLGALLAFIASPAAAQQPAAPQPDQDRPATTQTDAQADAATQTDAQQTDAQGRLQGGASADAQLGTGNLNDLNVAPGQRQSSSNQAQPAETGAGIRAQSSVNSGEAVAEPDLDNPPPPPGDDFQTGPMQRQLRQDQFSQEQYQQGQAVQSGANNYPYGPPQMQRRAGYRGAYGAADGAYANGATGYGQAVRGPVYMLRYDSMGREFICVNGQRVYFDSGPSQPGVAYGRGQARNGAADGAPGIPPQGPRTTMRPPTMNGQWNGQQWNGQQWNYQQQQQQRSGIEQQRSSDLQSEQGQPQTSDLQLQRDQQQQQQEQQQQQRSTNIPPADQPPAPPSDSGTPGQPSQPGAPEGEQPGTQPNPSQPTGVTGEEAT